EGINTFECKLVNVIEEINEYTIVIENNNGSKTKPIYFNINKEVWDNTKIKDKLHIKINDFYILR
ncbi:MAG: hypothetical protein WC151_12515, partial [Bacteroidales bacterium]